MKELTKSFKAIQELGLSKVWYYTRYRIGLRSGYYRRATPNRRDGFDGTPGLPSYQAFPNVTNTQKDAALAEADQICRGLVRLFGGDPVPLDLEAGASSEHWSLLERKPADRDIKFIWEPGRFGWAITLARAYAFTGDPVYAQNFWDNTLAFLIAHPPNLGRQWQSAQEVAIRLMAMVFCDRVFASAPSTKPELRLRLWQAVAEHARRIPPTFIYARAQNNNHLLSEAAGLYTAGLYLPEHPRAAEWRQSGWHWLNKGFQSQIDEFGTYVQHSTNYHRLMLQLALFTDHLRREANAPDWQLTTRARLDAATRWLWSLTDPLTGQAPNLGANDGADFIPLTSMRLCDYRPVVCAAARAFLNQEIYRAKNLNEMADWFNLKKSPAASGKQPQASDMLRLDKEKGRAFIHTAHFSDRPSHADQLHTDLWWRGVNVAPDPGTYLYNAAPPWNNTLATAQVHNTLILDGQDQMLRARRFLWLDWAQAEVLAHEINETGHVARITAEHDGYRRHGLRHQRTLVSTEEGWTVADAVLPYGRSDNKTHEAHLTWLLPDWTWSLVKGKLLNLTGPRFTFQLRIEGADQLNLFRAGFCLQGNMEPEPSWGWLSPTYGEKYPALMLIAVIRKPLPINLESIWRFEP